MTHTYASHIQLLQVRFQYMADLGLSIGIIYCSLQNDLITYLVFLLFSVPLNGRT